MKFRKKIIVSFILFLSGIAIVFAYTNFTRTGNNWDANVVNTQIANDVFTLNGTLSITDSRSDNYSAGDRGTIIGTIVSDLYGTFDIDTNIKLSLDSNQDLTTCGNNAIERYKLTGTITSAFWGTMTVDNTSYMCDNMYLYLSLSSASLGKKEIWGTTSTSNSNSTTTANIFEKQIISVAGILNTSNSLSGNILNRGNGDFKALDVSVSTKTISKLNVDKNIFNLYKNISNIRKNSFKLTDFTTPTTINGEDFFLYDYTGKTKTIKFNGNNYINEGQILEISNFNNKIAIKGKKTVIVKGGNIYIKSNLYNTNDNTSLLVLVAKRDKSTGNGGNIYIDTSVTNIDAVLVSDGSVISYNGGVIQSVGDAKHIINLRKQLLIYGSVFSSNTIGSDIMPYGSDYYKTSGYTNNTMTNNIYDFANLRTFNLNFGGFTNVDRTCSDVTKLTPIDTGVKSWAGGRNCYLSDPGVNNLRTSTKVNPLIIEYNPNISILKPYLLSTN